MKPVHTAQCCRVMGMAAIRMCTAAALLLAAGGGTDMPTPVQLCGRETCGRASTAAA